MDGHMEKKLANVQEVMYSLSAPHELLTVTSGYGESCIFYTDGSLNEDCAGFAVHQMGVGGFRHIIRSKVQLVFSLLRLVFCSLHYDTLLRLYGLWRYVLFSLIA
jgi:hypothetical protein